ncbi:MAG: DUF86 domain-containing protein [Candidatus Bathyarchaeia archaeon]|jgi:uncharacterized protein YutE (UPF0331/DUF86 family)
MPVDVNQIKQRLNEVLAAKAELKRLTGKPYEKLDMNEKYAIRYHVIVLAEALGNVCLHVAKEDLKQEPLSYSECFRLLDDEGISENCAKELTKLVRLRNLLTHRYWIIDDNQVYNSIKNDFHGVESLLESVSDKYAIDL